MTTAVAYGCFTEATVLGAGAKSMSGPASVLFGVRKEMKRTKIRKGTQKRIEFASGAECYTCSGQNCFRLNLNLESTKIKDALFLFFDGGYFRTVRSPAFIGFQVTLVLLLEKWIINGRCGALSFGLERNCEVQGFERQLVAQVPVVAGDEKQQGTVIVPKSKALEICTKGNERQG